MRGFGLPPLEVTFRGHHDQLQRSPKSAAEVTIVMSLVWRFQKGISCRGKYALFGLVWWSPKSAAEVTIVMSLVWPFQKGISCRSLQEESTGGVYRRGLQG